MPAERPSVRPHNRPFRYRLRLGGQRALPHLLRLAQLFLVVAFQVLGLRHVALVDAAVIVAERLAQGERGRIGQGGACHRPHHAADERDQLQQLHHRHARRLAGQRAQAHAAGDLQEALAVHRLAVQLGQVVDHPRLDAGQQHQVQHRHRHGPGGSGQRAVAEDVRQALTGVQVLQLVRRLVQGAQRLPHRGRQHFQQFLAQTRPAVLGVVETLFRRRQVDQRHPIRQSGEPAVLLGGAAQQVLGNRRRWRRWAVVAERVRQRVLLLRICFVQTGQHQHDRAARLGLAERAQVLDDIFLGVVQHLDDDDDDVGLIVEAGQVLGGVVAGFVEAARVEEHGQRRFRRRKLVEAGEARARLEALADLGAVGAGEVFDDRGLAALRLAEHPKDRHRQAVAQVVELFLNASAPIRDGEQTPEPIQHDGAPRRRVAQA